jgi:hypothetical protein
MINNQVSNQPTNQPTLAYCKHRYHYSCTKPDRRNTGYKWARYVGLVSFQRKKVTYCSIVNKMRTLYKQFLKSKVNLVAHYNAVTLLARLWVQMRLFPLFQILINENTEGSEHSTLRQVIRVVILCSCLSLLCIPSWCKSLVAKLITLRISAFRNIYFLKYSSHRKYSPNIRRRFVWRL